MTVGSRILREVRKELALFVTLVPLSRVLVHRPMWVTIIAFDASEVAGAVVYSRSAPDGLMELLSSYSIHARERCRKTEDRFHFSA